MTELILPVEPGHSVFLSDESRLAGAAQSISFPDSVDALRKVVTACRDQQVPVTVQGARTGISGGAVPLRGHILNLSKLNRIPREIHFRGEAPCIRVPAGITLGDLNGTLAGKGLFWPPDPTEAQATLGGIASNGANGPCSYGYGSLSRHIHALRVMDSSGADRWIEKDEGIDDFLGSEGMAGLILEMDLALRPVPGEIWGILFPFDDRVTALTFSEEIRSRWPAGWGDHGSAEHSGAGIVSVEFLDHTALERLSRFERAAGRPAIAEKILPSAALCIEIHGHAYPPVESLLVELSGEAAALGCDPDRTLAFSGPGEMMRFRQMRHSLMEAILWRDRDEGPGRCPGISIQCPEPGGRQVLESALAEASRAGAAPVVFGHGGLGIYHLFFPVHRGREEALAEIAGAAGGRLIFPYGMGKISSCWRKTPAWVRRARELQRIKKTRDPDLFWNPGNLD